MDRDIDSLELEVNNLELRVKDLEADYGLEKEKVKDLNERLSRIGNYLKGIEAAAKAAYRET